MITTPAAPTISEAVTDNRVLVGLRLYMGQNTLFANDRTGAQCGVSYGGMVGCKSRAERST